MVKSRSAKAAPPDRPARGGRLMTFRHPLWVRILHLVIAISIIVLIMSGLNILRAHPHLYWGTASNFGNAWIDIPDIPDWATIPNYYSLAQGRRWHFFFAWIFTFAVIGYIVLLLATGRFGRRWRPTRDDMRGFWASVVEHAKLHFPKDDEARRYNVLQKLTYIVIFFLVLPMMLLTGLTMSPGFNATAPGHLLLGLFGGRQSARTLHFLSGSAIVLFIFIHVALVIWTGFFNNLRSMVTGWFAIRPSASSRMIEALERSYDDTH